VFVRTASRWHRQVRSFPFTVNCFKCLWRRGSEEGAAVDLITIRLSIEKRGKGASDPIVYKSLWLITPAIRDRDRLRYHVLSRAIIVIIVIEARTEPTWRYRDEEDTQRRGDCQRGTRGTTQRLEEYLSKSGRQLVPYHVYGEGSKMNLLDPFRFGFIRGILKLTLSVFVSCSIHSGVLRRGWWKKSAVAVATGLCCRKPQ
jgi:hypothetical protein